MCGPCEDDDRSISPNIYGERENSGLNLRNVCRTGTIWILMDLDKFLGWSRYNESKDPTFDNISFPITVYISS
jgi:hypothetical protein